MDPKVMLDAILGIARDRARRRVVALRAAHPDESPRALSRRAIADVGFLAGLGGAASGVASIVALPVGLPAGLAVTLLLEAELLLALLELHGYAGEDDVGRTRLFALWAGAGFADAAKSAGLNLGASAAAAVVAGSLPARLIARLHPRLVELVVKRLGLGFVVRAAKFWPLVGAPIGFVVDRAAVRLLGRLALDTLDRAATAEEVAAAER